MRPQPVRHAPGKVYAYDMLQAPWSEAGRPGFYHKAVRGDRERGLFLGLLSFDPLTRTGVHQHLGVAVSYFLDGSLTDYWGAAVAGQAGINLKGATHDAVSYGKTTPGTNSTPARVRRASSTRRLKLRPTSTSPWTRSARCPRASPASPAASCTTTMAATTTAASSSSP